VLDAFRSDKGLARFHRGRAHNPKLKVIDYDGRLYLAYTSDRYDVIDLSLADSAGLSSPGGFAIVEKFSITRGPWRNYMRALKAGVSRAASRRCGFEASKPTSAAGERRRTRPP